MNKKSPHLPRFSRRSLLRGLGAGTALLSPLVRPRASLAQAAPAGNLLIFYTPNGHKRRLLTGELCFDAAAAPGGMTLGRSLMPLQPFQGDVAVIRGLNLKTPTFITSHQDLCRILTCWGAPVEGNDQTQFTAFGPSIDQTIGAALNQKPLVVAVDPYRDLQQWRTTLSWSAAGVVAPFTKDHKAVFDDLFGSLRGRDALARTRARNAATFQARTNTQSLAHHSAYLDALQSIEHRGTAALPTCATNDLASRIAALPAHATVQIDDKSPDGAVAELQLRGELWMDMMATAFACGSRRVGVIQWQGGAEGYDPVGNLGSPTHHSTTMGAFDAEHWVGIDTWYAQRFAYQLAALKRVGVLDRTIVVWVSEITEGHNQLDMVTVVAGGQALGMKTGRYIQYPFTGTETDDSSAIPMARNPANRSLADLWITVQQAMGVNSGTFGDPKWSTGPLTELRG